MVIPTIEIILPPVPSAQTFTDKTGILTQPAQQWLVNLRDKVNAINALIISISGAGTPIGAFNALSPLTTNGDLLTYSGGTNTRLPIGTNGQVLTVVSGMPTWSTGAGVSNPDTFNPPDPYNFTTFTLVTMTATFLPNSLTINSTGASQGSLCRNGVWETNGSITAGITQAPDSGIVYRLIDVNNYYLLVVHDASASGTPNTLTLYKNVAGTFTSLGSSAISFTRGTSHTFKLSVSGTSLTGYFDGISVITATDSSLSGPGWLGLRHNGATATIFTSLSWA